MELFIPVHQEQPWEPWSAGCSGTCVWVDVGRHSYHKAQPPYGLISWFPTRYPIHKGHHSQADDTRTSFQACFLLENRQKTLSIVILTGFACRFFFSFWERCAYICLSRCIKPASPFTFQGTSGGQEDTLLSFLDSLLGKETHLIFHQVL